MFVSVSVSASVSASASASTISAFSTCPAKPPPATPVLVDADEESSPECVYCIQACPICCNIIVEASETFEGQEALLCESTCQKWLHRWCAGVHKENYRDLASSDKPFVCPSCSLAEHRRMITTLLETVEYLKEEVKQLKEEKLATPRLYSAKNSDAANKVPHEVPIESSPAAQVKEGEKPWHTVIRKDKRGSKVRKDNSNKNGKQKSSGQPNYQRNRRHSAPVQGQSTSTSGSQQRIKVSGVRRIWGTLRSCTQGTVKNVLKRFTTVCDKVEIRRMYKSSKDGKSANRWWFILRAPENILCTLESEWESVQNQTNWKLEECTQPLPFLDKQS